MTRKAEQAEITRKAQARLRELFPIGSTVTTDLKHVSRSGMTRDIAVIAVVDGAPLNVSYLVREATGMRMAPDANALRIGGCGMDMGFYVAYTLARVIYRDGFRCTNNDRCPSNDHVNARPADGESWSDARARTYGPEVMHSDPGYALRHRWL